MEEKEHLLFEKVKELMFRYGIKSLTMDDIAQQLGISKKTLYQFVENKADLVNKIVQRSIYERSAGVQCIVQEEENAIKEVLRIYMQNTQMSKNMNSALVFDLQKYFPESWKIIQSFRNSFIFDCIKRNLVKGIEQGLYRADLNADIIAKLYISRIFDIYNPDMFPPLEYPTDLILREMFLYHMRGIASEKGVAYLEKEVIPEL